MYYDAQTPGADSLHKPEKLPVPPTTTLDSDVILPAPVVHFSSGSSSGRRSQRRFRETVSHRLREMYDSMRSKFGSGTAPSDSSTELDMDADSTLDGEDIGRMRGSLVGDGDIVDQVVVDREWGEDIRGSSTHSEHGEERTGSNPQTDRMADVADDFAGRETGCWGRTPFLRFLRTRIWPTIVKFFVMQFVDEKSEQQYRRENWYLRKHIALWSAAYYILNWVLSVVFVPQPLQLADKIFHYGIAPAFSFPILFMVLWDFPRDRPWIYQSVLTVSAWQYGVYQILFMYLCDYYGPSSAIPHSLFNCGNRDFLPTFYYANGPQTMALFGLGLARFPALVGTLTFMSICFGWIVPVHTSFIRNVINFMCFQAFLLYTHYMRENAERRLYVLRDQLKVQYRATQKAQVNERKAADSKRRLTSYVFHEVRVPLNTALLAVQNMAASGIVVKEQEIEFKALQGSLSMMSKVLNDVLDFNRMDSGRFESVARPYPFHQVMRSLFVPLKLATNARSLEFVVDLDRRIDEVARRAMYEALGLTEEEIQKRLVEAPDEDGIVVGDEVRLRQVITNLASNACKFTPAGGNLTITTRLILPQRNPIPRVESITVAGSDAKLSSGASSDSPASVFKDLTNELPTPVPPQLSRTHLARHNSYHSSKPNPLEWIAVRIEVTDTGKGIRPKDMIECRLFSAFNQTELGRQQGGKGTGLGLALVRQIVKLTGGRLGVRSKVNEGSTFWVELRKSVVANPCATSSETFSVALGVGAKASPWSAGTPQFEPQTDVARPEVIATELGLHNESPVLAPMRPRRLPPRASSSAMHSIMEQGGLVEISADGMDDGRVLTRTLGDRSTGTDPTPTVPLTTPESSPIPPVQLPPIVLAHSSDLPARPQFVQLPERELFVDAFSSSAHGSPAHTPSDSEHSTPPAWEPGMRVLVVDDDPMTRKLMARMLTRLGCKVSTAENGAIALDLILGHAHSARTTPSEEAGMSGLTIEAIHTSGGDEHKYAVVFLDNQMPVLSGLDSVAKLRELGRNDFVVGVTGE
ncbi:hypothetical protein EIP86_006155 [Pleurotus ostreatoroseus]|nr:hypothetical protein EIP86_006155 [Pleurotus ostreatoroseus]